MEVSIVIIEKRKYTVNVNKTIKEEAEKQLAKVIAYVGVNSISMENEKLVSQSIKINGKDIDDLEFETF